MAFCSHCAFRAGFANSQNAQITGFTSRIRVSQDSAYNSRSSYNVVIQHSVVEAIANGALAVQDFSPGVNVSNEH
jgi:hypothetical protein